MILDEEGWLHNIHIFSQFRGSDRVMTEYEVKFYEAACELMEKTARYHKLVLEASIKRVEDNLKNEQTSGD